MSDSLQPHGLLPARLLWPWDFPGKTTGVGSHFLLQEIFLTQGLNPGPLHCRWPPALQAGSFLSHQCCVLSHFSHVQPFAIPWIAGSPQASLSMEFPRQEYWSGLPCPSPEDLPDSGIGPMSLMFPALAGSFFTTSTTWAGPSHQGMRHLQKLLSLRQPGAGAGGEGSTLNRCQIVMLLPDDAHNTLTKCSSKTWNT